jgi:hypothetical protein
VPSEFSTRKKLRERGMLNHELQTLGDLSVTLRFSWVLNGFYPIETNSIEIEGVGVNSGRN